MPASKEDASSSYSSSARKFSRLRPPPLSDLLLFDLSAAASQHNQVCVGRFLESKKKTSIQYVQCIYFSEEEDDKDAVRGSGSRDRGRGRVNEVSNGGGGGQLRNPPRRLPPPLPPPPHPPPPPLRPPRIFGTSSGMMVGNSFENSGSMLNVKVLYVFVFVHT